MTDRKTGILDDLKAQIRDIESCSSNSPYKEDVEDEKKIIANGAEASEKLQSSYFKRIIRLLSVRERSSLELRERLLRDAKGDPLAEEEIQKAIEKACRSQLVDDIRFAGYLITKRVREGVGKKGIERELQKHGIDPELVPGWPDDFIPLDISEKQRALELIRSKPPQSKNIQGATYQKLIRKGYSSDVASSVARVYSEERKTL